MISSTCYQIRAGGITPMDIPTTGLTLLGAKKMADSNLVAFPGDEDADWLSYTLERVTEIATIVTPWATWYCSPDARDGDKIKPTTYGWAYWTRDAVWLRSSLHPDGAIQGAFHEAYHAAEHWLTGDEIEVLRRASENGPVMPRASAYNEYWCADLEVRARAFSAWSYAHWLMGSAPMARRGDPAHVKIWILIYSGSLGLRAARKGYIRRDQLPDALRQRAEQPTVSQKVITATWSGLAAAYEWIADAFRPGASPVKSRAGK